MFFRQQPLKCDNEEIDCVVAELDQKTKLILHVISQSSIILLSHFVHFMPNVVTSILCAVFPNVPVVIALGLHNCFELVANSDRKNIFHEKAFRYRH